MGYGFDVEKKEFPDNVDGSDTATAIEEWLDDLDIGSSKTIYELSVVHKSGFWHVILIYGEN